MGSDDQTDNCETGQQGPDVRLTLDRIESRSWRVSASFTRTLMCIGAIVAFRRDGRAYTRACGGHHWILANSMFKAIYPGTQHS